MGKLKGKTAIILGAGRPLSEATAHLFLHEGATVMLVDRDERQLRETCDHLGRFCAFVAADTSDPRSARRYAEVTVDKFGGIDILFAHAGFAGPERAMRELASEDFERVVSVNLLSAFHGMREVAPSMIKRGAGSIVLGATAPSAHATSSVAYAAARHALLGLGRAAALELARDHIRVNMVHQGLLGDRKVATGELRALGDASPREAASPYEHVALRRSGAYEEIARLVLFLASDDASYCTGATFVADGGLA